MFRKKKTEYQSYRNAADTKKAKPAIKALKFSFVMAAIGLTVNAWYQQYVPEALKTEMYQRSYRFNADHIYPHLPSWAKDSPDKVYDTKYIDSLANSDLQTIEIENTRLEPLFASGHDIVERGAAFFGRQQILMASGQNSQLFEDWCENLNHLLGLSLEEKAKGVDEFVDNFVDYNSDGNTYNSGDFFASPIETIQNRKGDCDDYAILKYFALRYLGVPADRLYICVVDTEGRPDTINHAVLMVDMTSRSPVHYLRTAFGANLKRNFMILDNETSNFGKVHGELKKPSESGYSYHYLMNDTGFWKKDDSPKLK